MPLEPSGWSTTTQAGPRSRSTGVGELESLSAARSSQLVSAAGGSGGASGRIRGTAKSTSPGPASVCTTRSPGRSSSQSTFSYWSTSVMRRRRASAMSRRNSTRLLVVAISSRSFDRVDDIATPPFGMPVRR
jgi:hypothetical protein